MIPDHDLGRPHKPVVSWKIAVGMIVLVALAYIGGTLVTGGTLFWQKDELPTDMIINTPSPGTSVASTSVVSVVAGTVPAAATTTLAP